MGSSHLCNCSYLPQMSFKHFNVIFSKYQDHVTIMLFNTTLKEIDKFIYYIHCKSQEINVYRDICGPLTNVFPTN